MINDKELLSEKDYRLHLNQPEGIFAKLFGTKGKMLELMLRRCSPLTNEWVSNKTTRTELANKMGVSEISIKRYIAEYKDKGILVDGSGRGVYRFNPIYVEVLLVKTRKKKK